MIQNPILPGFSPDPSIVRVGEDYFLATSTFEWFPGVRLHHSRDLVHWRQVANALTTCEHLDLRGIPDSGGVWAPSLSHADGQFWLIYTNVRTCGLGRPFKDLSIFLTTAPKIDGPWSAPVELNSIGFDPSLFHDDNGRKWLVNMEWDFRQTGAGRFGGIVLQEYDHEARRLVGPSKKILQKPVLCEGPNLYKRNGWYYLMTADGGTGWEHRISMARSRTIAGPYETDSQQAVLTTCDAPTSVLQKAGHGELVETPNGEWYLAHLASRPVVGPNSEHTAACPPRSFSELRRCVLGRETCLQKVIWTPEGWLRLDPAVPAAGAACDKPWHPRLAVPPPAGIASSPWPSPLGRDDFDRPSLDVTWSSLRVPVEEHWLTLTARPGWLRLRGRDSLHSWFKQSLVAKPLRSSRCVAETCLEFSPAHFTQAAGLVCYYDTRTYYYLRVTSHETLGRVLSIAITDDAVYREPAPAEQLAVNDWPRCFLRATIDETTLHFTASPDGRDWRAVGPSLDATKLSDDYGNALHFTGAMVGICAQDLANTGATADFDYFSLTAL